MQIADLRAKYPGYSDDEILAGLRATKYPDYSIEEIGKAVGYNPSDLGRGFKEAFQQLPQLGYGVLAGVGAAGEAVVGEGGIMSGLKKAGVKGFNEWGDKIEAGARESDSFTYSYDQAKEGNFGSLVDWLQHGLGYVGGQGLQALASAGIGSVAGKFALGTAAKDIAKGMVLKEAAVLGATAEGKALAQDVLIAQATQNVASRIGQAVGVGAMAFGQEGGEIFGDLTAGAEKDGRQLSGDELAKAFGATLAAGSLEFVGDKFGLDLVMGKSRLGNKLMGMAEGAPGVTGKLARGALAGAVAIPAEAGTEYFQTGIEEYGKGKEANILPFNQSEEARTGAFDAAMLGGLGGGAIGGATGLMSRAREAQAQQVLQTSTDVGEMTRAATEIAMVPLAPAMPRTPAVVPPTFEPATEYDTGEQAGARWQELYDIGRGTDKKAGRVFTTEEQAEWDALGGIQRQAAQASPVLPDDLLTADNMPYGTRAAAAVRATREGGGEVVQVPGGFVVRRKAPNEPVDNLAGATAEPVGPADGSGDQPGGSGGIVRPGAAVTGPAVPGAVAPDAGGEANAPVADGSREPGAALTLTAPGTLGDDMVKRVEAAMPKALARTDLTPEQRATFAEALEAAGRARTTGLAEGEFADKIVGSLMAAQKLAPATPDAPTAAAPGEATPSAQPSATTQDAAALTAEPSTPAPLKGRVDALRPEHSTDDPTLDAAAHGAATSHLNDSPVPTPAQLGAGNYQKGHYRLESIGKSISIETAKGTERVAKDGSWRVPKMPAHYGDINRTEGADGDPVDLFIGDRGDNGRFWVINQHEAGNPSKFDEHKIITGVDSADEAVAVYKGSFADNFGDKVFSSISAEHDGAALNALLPSLKKAKPVPSLKDRVDAQRIPPAQPLPDWTEAEVGKDGKVAFEIEGDQLVALYDGTKVASVSLDMARKGDFFAQSNIRKGIVEAQLKALGVDAVASKESVDNGPEIRAKKEAREDEQSRARRAIERAVEQANAAGATNTAGKLARLLRYVGHGTGPKAAFEAAENVDRAISDELEEAAEKAAPKAKKPPKSFRKKVTVKTDVFVEESGKFEAREIDADAAIKALDEDIGELEAFRKCITGG